jgi:DNA-binding NtrC family response regulator
VPNETVLLAEDEAGVRSPVRRILAAHGYRVLEAEDGPTALEVAGRHDGAIDLLLTDVVMPEMSGPALAQRLIELRPELRVLFISGYADVAVQPQIGGPNVNFLSKPFQASALTARVAQILGANARAEVRP